MEYTQWVYSFAICATNYEVLILVVMEYTQWVDILQEDVVSGQES